MALTPRRAPVGAARQQDVGDGEEDLFEDEGDFGLEGQDGAGQTEDDAALDTGEEQETGGEEDVEFDEERVERVAGRAVTRIQRLANENAELRRQVATRAQPPGPTFQPPGPTFQPPAGLQEENDEQFTARLQLLPPDERMEQRYLRDKRQSNQRMAFFQFQQTELHDKTSFDAKSVADPRYKRWAAEVEAKRQEFMQGGQIVPREVVLKYLLGEHMLSPQGTKETRRRVQRGQERVRRQETRPTGAGSDVVAPRRGQLTEAQARAKRLAGMQI